MRFKPFVRDKKQGFEFKGDSFRVELSTFSKNSGSGAATIYNKDFSTSELY